MRIVLEKKDLWDIALAIAGKTENEGHIFVELNELEFEVSYRKSYSTCYDETTGFQYVKDAQVSLLDLKCGDLNLDYDEDEIEKASASYMEY